MADQNLFQGNKIANLISLKLDDMNFKQWKQQISGVIRGLDLQKYITNPEIPEKFLTNEDLASGTVNPLYLRWEKHDALICTWILSTISDSHSLLAKVVDFTYSSQAWDAIHLHFDTLLTTKARQLRSELRSLSKGDRTITEFIKRVRVINESLISVGDPVPLRNLIEVVLDALLEDYDSVVAAISSKSSTVSIDEVESDLLAHELRLEKNKKQSITDAASVNLAHTPSLPASSSNSDSEAPPTPNSSFPNGSSHVTAGHSQGGEGSYRGGRNGRGGARSGRGGRGGRGVTCQICNRNNHDASICHYRHTGTMLGFGYGYRPQPPPHFQPQYPAPFSGYGYGYPPRPQQQPRPQALLTGSSSAFNNQWWYPDAGASHHVTPDATNLSDATSFSGSDQVLMGNGQGLPINSLGSMCFTSQTNPKTSLALNNLLLVPNITKNLMSVSKFAQDNNVYFEFHPSFCVVKSQASSEVLLHGVVGADGLYKFASPLVSFPALNKSKQCNSFSLLSPSISTTSLNNSKQCNSVSMPNTSLFTLPAIQNANVNISQYSNNENSAYLYNLWHDRLGHPHHDALKEALKICNIHISSKPQNVFCSDCCLGKSHRLHAPASTTVYTLPLELIVCDLWGPAPITSSSGFTYFLTCVDAFSRFVWVYPLKKKSDTYNTFIQFQSMVELQFNCKIKSVQTDGGGEFKPLTQHLNKLGVTHRLTCPHTHHQNGLVERKHRHLVETGLTLLSKANLPMKYWDHAFITAAFLINRIPTPVLQNNSPYYVLLNKHPDYKALKIFGCACFPFLRPYHSTKLAYRSQECVFFLGYSSTYKGYKCLSSDGRVYVSKDVLFNEQRFPYNQIFSKNKPVPTSPASTNSPSQLSLFLPSLSTNTPTPTQQTSSPPPTSPSASNTPTQPPVLNPIPLTTIPMSPDISTPTSLSDYSTTSSPPIQNSNASQHIFSSPSSGASSSISTPVLPTIPPRVSHHMLTRSKTKNQPTILVTHIEPTSVKQELLSSHWHAAMKDEYDALIRNNTWTLVPPPVHKQPIGCKWVFRVKENPDGTIHKYKARLVAKGFHQQAGSDFTETFSPVVKLVTVKTVLTMAVSNKWPIQQIDVNNAFLNGILEEEVYMQQPPGFEASDKTLICKLNKALYGLKQAPRAWFDRLKTALLGYGFQASKCDPSLFMMKTSKIHLIVLVYVDDIIITGSSMPHIQKLISNLNAEFALKQLGTLDYFLGIEVFHLADGSLLLSQAKYIRDLLSKAKMDTANGMPTPMASTLKLSKVGSIPVDDPTQFRSIVGALQYATLTRPEIAYSVNKVCQFLSNPLEEHWKAVKRILRYLSGTLHYGLLIQVAPIDKPLTLIGFCDADWASDPDDRRSTSGACIYVGPNLVSWWSKKQTLVARSNAEAEYRSLANLSLEILWLQSLLTELGCKFYTPKILCDNLSTVSLAHNPTLHYRTKHMELDIFFVREKVLNRSLIVSHVPAQDQWADVLTKPLSAAKFCALRDKLRVYDKYSFIKPSPASTGEC
ncbi:putative mitochondrial protein [Trifolium repens]|nr:putative mitochondrial protein [Trifolium repens]